MGEEIDAQRAEVVEAEPVRALQPWQREAGTVALAAAGGAAAGLATVAVVRAARGSGRRPLLRLPGRARERVVASRSFLIDVHVLGR